MSDSRFPYSEAYQPAFPTLPVIVHNSEDGIRTEVIHGLLDTGSDGTLVPLTLLREIQAPILQEARIRSHWGEGRTVAVFQVDLTIAELTLPGIFVVGDDEGDEIILGRDVLNKLRLELDGPEKLIQVFPQ